jgi:flagellar biosynthetic protein FliR
VAGGTALLLDVLTLGGEVAICVAAPAVITLFMANIAMGFISRTVPQLNIAVLGFSFKALVGFLIMAISLPVAVGAFTGAVERVVGWLEELIDV